MIKFLIDSASDLEMEEANRLGVAMVPMTVRFGDEEYLDGVNLSHRAFFEKLIASEELPKTSLINEFTWTEKFAELTADGSEVIVLTLSSKLSHTYECAESASKAFRGVYVVDTLQPTIGERILLEYGLKLQKEGKSAEEIFTLLEAKKHLIHLYGVLDTLKYLRKGGRISTVTAIVGELLTVKPVITIAKGEVKLIGKAIGLKKGNNMLNQLVDKCGGIDYSMPYAVAYSGLSEDVLNKYLNDSRALWENKCEKVPAYLIGSAIGTHIGPNAVAVAFFANEESQFIV